MGNIFENGNFDLSDLARLPKLRFTITSRTATGWSVDLILKDAPPLHVRVEGRGFAFDGDVLSSGIVTSIALSDDSGHSLVRSGLSLPAKALSEAFGLARDESGDDSTRGGNGRDHLVGGGGDDKLDGGAGNDRLAGGTGDDHLVGGAGKDSADFEESRASVTVDLAAGTARGDGRDTLRQIENVIGSRHADTIGGDGAANFLRGGGGNDRLEGRAGNDILAGEGGDDRASGGVGDDILQGGAGADRLEGGDGKDIIWGDAGADRLSGGGGRDNVDGGAGRDTVTGGLGTDRLVGGQDRDTFVFDSRLDAKTNVDFVIDLKVGEDRLALDHHIFTALTKTGGLSSDAFYAGPAAHDASDRIIYNRGTGVVSYDADGNGAGKAVAFAIMDNGVALTVHDVFVV